MDPDDKIKNKADEAAGAAKEKAGKAADDEQLEAEGRSEKSKAKGKQVVDHVTEKAKDVADNTRQAFKRDR